MRKRNQKEREHWSIDDGLVSTLQHYLSNLFQNTVRYVLNTFAEMAPTWFRSVALDEWYDRYSQRLEDTCLSQKLEERDALTSQIGFDG